MQVKYIFDTIESKKPDYTFEQTWGNTSGGFESIGGDVLTKQLTEIYVYQDKEDNETYAIVVFGGNFGYCAVLDEIMMEHIKCKKVRGVYSAIETYKIFYFGKGIKRS